MKKTTTRLLSFITSLMFLFAATASLAANGVWNGTVDALWTNSANWSDAYPSGAETATFTNAADTAITTIDVAGLTSINNIIFDSPSVAAYTNGTGAANSQTLVLGDNGSITLTGTAANSQLFNAGLQLGTTIAGSTYTLNNANMSQALIFNNIFGPASGGTAGGKTLVVSGAGNTTILGTISRGGASSMAFTDTSSGTCTVLSTNTITTVTMSGTGILLLPGSNTVNTLNMNGDANSVVDIGDGFLAISNGGGTTLSSTQGGIINGTGKLWLSVDVGNANNYGDNSVSAGKTLVINTPIISPAGFEFWGGGTTFGTFVLNATNTFEKDVIFNVAGAISAWKIGKKGSTTSNLGKGNTITFNGNATPGAKLIYTGTGEETDRTLSLTYGAVLDHSGTGTLKFTEPLILSGNAKTLILQGSTSGIGEIAGVIPNGANTSLEKNGTGTWVLSAVNAYPGATTIKNGKLIVSTAGSCANSAVKLQSSGAGATAILSLSVSDSSKQWTCASLMTTNDLTGGNTPVLDFAFYSTPGLAIAPLRVTGNVVFESLPAITVNPANLVSGNSYPLLIAGGSVPVTAPTSVTLGSGLTGSVAWGTGTPFSAKTLVLTVSGTSTSVLPLHWTGTGAGTGVWNLNTPANLVWTNSATPPEAAYYQEVTAGDQVLFDDTHISADQTVTLDETVKPFGVTFDNSLYGYTVTGNGAISGFTSLNKSGTNTLTLGTANTYSDITALKGGTLKLGNTLALPSGNIVSMSGTAALDLNGYTASIGNISDSFASNQITDNSAGAGTNALSILNHATTVSALIKDGASKKVALAIRNNNAGFASFPTTAANTYSGGLLLKNGAALGAGTRLRIMSPVTTVGTPGNITSSPFGTGPITIGEAGTDKAQILLDTVANNSIANDIVVNTSLGTDAAYALRVDTAGNSLRGAVTVNADLTVGGPGVATLDNAISGTGGVRVVAGTLILTGASTYAGKTTIAGGTLAMTSINNVSDGPSPLGDPVTVSDGTLRIGSVANGGTLRYIGMGDSTDRVIDMAGTTGNATLDQSGTNALVFTGGLALSGAGPKTLTLQGSTIGTGEFTGIISNGVGSIISVTKTGTGAWTLSNSNTHGKTTLNSGTLIVANPNALGTNLLVDITGNATLDFANDAGAGLYNYGFWFSSGFVSTITSGRATPGAAINRQLGYSGLGNSTLIFTNGANVTSGTPTFTIDLLNVSAGGSGTATLVPINANLSIGAATIVTSSAAKTLQLDGTSSGNTVGVISNGLNTLSITKANSSTWTLPGANTYTGATTVKGGTLLVNGSTASGSAISVLNGGMLGGRGTLNGAVSVTAGGLLAPGGINETNTLTLANNSATSLTLNGATLFYDLPASGTACDLIAITGANGRLVLNGNNTIALSFPYGSAPEGTYTLMTYAGKTGTGTLNLIGAYPNISAAITVGPTAVTLTVGAGGTYGLTWQGGVSSLWDGDLNWSTNGSPAVAFQAGDPVTFDDTATGSLTVTSGAAVSPASVVFNNSVKEYTISAAINGTTPVMKSGGGLATLSGTNTYTGPMTIFGGSLTIGGAGLLNSGAYAGAIVNYGTFTYASSEAQTLSGIISAEGTVAKAGAGTLTLTAANTYVGPTIVNAGVLRIQNASGLGTTAAGTTVNAGGTLDLAGNITTTGEALNLFGTLSCQTGTNTYAGVVSQQANSIIDVAADSLLILTASTPNIGANPFSKTGAGILRLTADPNHRGVCTVAGGTLELTGGGSADADFIIDAGATLMETTANLGDYRLTDNGTFDLRVNDQIGGLDGSGLVTIGNTGSYTFSVGGGNQSGAFSGVMQDGTGKLSFQKNGSGVQILTGVNTYTGTTIVAGGTLLVNAPGSLAANSAVTVNNFGTLGGSGTIYGMVNVVAGGTLLPGDTNAIATLTLGNTSATTLTLNGNILRYDISNVAGASDTIVLTGTGGLVLNGVNVIALSFPNGAAPAGDYTLMTFQSYTGTGSFALSGNYPNNASLELTANSLILHVTSASVYDGMTWRGIQSGIWDNGVQNWTTNNIDLLAYTPGSAVIFDDTATGNFTVNSGAAVSPASMLFNNSVNAYTLSANVSGTGPLVKQGTGAVTLSGVNAYNPSVIDIYPGTLTLGGASQLNSGYYAGDITNNGTFAYASSMSQTLSGNISGSGALNKSGTSTLILSGTNTYVGATTVSAGTLKISSGYMRAATAGNMNVSAGAKLEMDGGVNTLAEQLLLTGTLSCPTGNTTCANNIYTYNGAIFDVAAGAILTLSGSTADTGTGNAIIKTNAGLLRLTRDPNHKGTMTIKGGTVELAAGTTDGDYVINSGATLIATVGNAINDPNGVTVNAGGLYILRQSDTINMFTGAGTLTKDTPGAATLSVGNSNGSGTFSGVIENGLGTLAFNKNGTGTQTLSGTNTYSGGMTINTGILMIDGAGLLGSGFYAGAIVNKATLVYASSAQQTFGGVISDIGALRKIGTGSLTLTALNTYSGATSVSNGILTGVTGGGCANSAVTVRSSGSGASATLGIRYTGANTKWTCSSLTTVAGVSGGGAPKLQFVFNADPSTTEAPLNVTGNVALDGATTISIVPSMSMVAGDYPLLIAGGTVPATMPLVTIGRGLSGSVSWGKAPYTAKTLVLTVSGVTTQPLKWNQTTSGTWDANNAGNAVWMDNTTSATYYQQTLVGDHVVFDDTVTADTAVTLNTAVTPASLTFNNSAFSYTLSGSGQIAGDIGLVKAGTNGVTLATANSYSGGSTVSAGALKVASGGSISHAGADVVVGNSTTPVSSNALLKIESGASVLAKWVQAGTANGAVGAIHNQGALTVSPLNNTICFALGSGVGGYGYYRHDTAKALTVAEMAVAGSAGGNGVVDILQGVVTNSLYFLVTRGAVAQYAQVNVTGGTLIMPDSNGNVSMFNTSSSGQGIINVGANSMLGSLGNATELDLIKTSTSGSAIGVLNILSGGLVQATRVKATQGAGTALVNFNGGTLKAKYAQHDTGALLGGSNIDRATIYASGATIDTDTNNINFTQALLAPTGSGVTSIPITANGTGYIGRPVVYITGGGGTGATAVADYDPVSQTVTNITVTSPGYNYATTPTVTITGGGGTPPTLGAVTFGTVSSGGLTKTGTGMLLLYGANTYTGLTSIDMGTLRLGLGNVLPITAAVTVNNGSTYDLNGFTVTNSTVSMVNGSIVNGTLKISTLNNVGDGVINARISSTSGLTKVGSGVLTISTPQDYTGETAINAGTLRLAGCQPGLYEGRVAGAFDLAAANPKTAVLLSTRYANLYFGSAGASYGIWPDNTTYIYTGYLWNNSPTNETWSFMRVFDDSTRIMLNGTNILANTASGAIVSSNAVVRPGANTFELRLGQGAGAVGNNQVAWPNMGIGYDRMGRNQLVFANFKTLTDPGDGSLLTTTNEITQSNLLPTVSQVTIAAGAVLELGGTSQSLAGLSGSGWVTNGTLAVTGVVAPGGTNVIGTLTLATTNTLTGTLRVDLSEDGSCDVLAVKGDVALTGMALTADIIGQLTDLSLQYTILTCTGTRTGTFGTKTIPSGWMVSYENNGDVKIVYAGGTMIRIM